MRPHMQLRPGGCRCTLLQYFGLWRVFVCSFFCYCRCVCCWGSMWDWFRACGRVPQGERKRVEGTGVLVAPTSERVGETGISVGGIGVRLGGRCEGGGEVVNTNPLGIL